MNLSTVDRKTANGVEVSARVSRVTIAHDGVTDREEPVRQLVLAMTYPEDATKKDIERVAKQAVREALQRAGSKATP
jgi:hypothetical protein